MDFAYQIFSLKRKEKYELGRLDLSLQSSTPSRKLKIPKPKQNPTEGAKPQIEALQTPQVNGAE